MVAFVLLWSEYITSSTVDLCCCKANVSLQMVTAPYRISIGAVVLKKHSVAQRKKGWGNGNLNIRLFLHFVKHTVDFAAHFLFWKRRFAIRCNPRFSNKTAKIWIWVLTRAFWRAKMVSIRNGLWFFCENWSKPFYKRFSENRFSKYCIFCNVAVVLVE